MQSYLKLFRVVAFIEGISFLLFGITVPLKYWYEMPAPNMIVGTAHGFLFIAYILLLLLVASQYKWTWLKMALAFAASLLPFGTFIADRFLFNKKPGF